MADFGQGYFYTPEDQSQIDALTRQRKLALALQQQGLQDPGDAPYGGLANAGKSLAGALLGTGLDQKERDIAQTAEQARAKMISNILNGNAGGSVTNSAGSPMQGPSELDPEGNPMPSTAPSAPLPNQTDPEGNPLNSMRPAQPMQQQGNYSPDMIRGLAMGDPFALATFQHQQTINDNRVTPLSAEDNAAFIKANNLPPGLYGRDVSGNIKPVVQSDMKSKGAIEQGIQAEVDKANRVPLTAAEQQAHRDRIAQINVTANQPHFVPYGTSSYIQNGKVVNLGGAGTPGAPGAGIPGGDPNSKSPNGQLGISSNAYNLLIGNTAAVPRGRPMDMASRELDQMIQQRGLDPSIVKPRVQAYGDAVKMNTLKANTMDTLSNELTGTIQNLAPVADKLGGGNIRWTKEGAQIIGGLANDPNAQQYVYYLNQLRSELAGFNAVAGGKIGLHGQVEVNESHIAEAEKVIRNGLDSGGARGLGQAIEASRSKNIAVVEHQSNEAQRGIWNALGLGPQYDKLHPNAAPPPANGGGNSGGGKHPPPPPGFVVH